MSLIVCKELPNIYIQTEQIYSLFLTNIFCDLNKINKHAKSNISSVKCCIWQNVHKEFARTAFATMGEFCASCQNELIELMIFLICSTPDQYLRPCVVAYQMDGIVPFHLEIPSGYYPPSVPIWEGAIIYTRVIWQSRLNIQWPKRPADPDRHCGAPDHPAGKRSPEKPESPTISQKKKKQGKDRMWTLWRTILLEFVTPWGPQTSVAILPPVMGFDHYQMGNICLKIQTSYINKIL